MISITRQFHVALLIGLAAGIAIAVAATTIVSAQSATLSTEVRITARLLENGKVEFGLQQREGGAWGEIILPRVNKFPYASATIDRWLYSSRVAVTATATEPEPAAATGAWQRDTPVFSHSPDWRIVDWTLAGTGEYAAGGRADWEYSADPQLLLRCLTYSDGDTGNLVLFTAEEGYPYPGSGRGAKSLRARVGGGDEHRVEALAWDSIFPFYTPFSDQAFLDWLAVNYARSGPMLTLDAYADGALYFSGTFDLTGLPAVLAGLPCYE